MNEVEQIELHIEDARNFIKQSDALKRLQKNEDFKLVFEEAYFKENAIRLVSLKSAPGMQAPEKQADILRSMDSIGELQQWLNAMLVMSTDAQRAIDDAHEELAAMANEGTE